MLTIENAKVIDNDKNKMYVPPTLIEEIKKYMYVDILKMMVVVIILAILLFFLVLSLIRKNGPIYKFCDKGKEYYLD